MNTKMKKNLKKPSKDKFTSSKKNKSKQNQKKIDLTPKLKEWPLKLTITTSKPISGPELQKTIIKQILQLIQYGPKFIHISKGGPMLINMWVGM